MKLKTYRAATMAEALSSVKKDLGKDAVILHTRSVRVGGFLGLNKKTLIEITAADEPTGTSRVQRRAPKHQIETVPALAMTASPTVAASPILAATSALKAYGASPRAAVAHAASLEQPAPAASAPSGASTTQQAARAGAIPASPFAVAASPEPSLMTVRERRVAGAGSKARTVARAITPSDGGDDLFRELADIKLLVNQVLHSNPSTGAGVAAGAMPEPLFRHYLRLLESAVARDIADEIIGAVRDELTPGEMQDETIVRTTVLRHIAELIPVADVASADARGGAKGNGPLVIALIGPTGVGKTTTIAKLAASYKLRHGKSVALITSDTYRIAAVDQLRTYAGIIGLPLKVVLTAQEMAQAVESLRGYDVILIDTAGRSQNNADRLLELREFLDAASPTEVHLVLSSTAAEPVLERTADAFAALAPSRIILTKLDEAVNFGVIVNVSRRLNTALSFVTTGQEVPDDIEPGHPARLARMVLDNSVVSTAPQAAMARRPRNPSNADREAVLVGGGVA